MASANENHKATVRRCPLDDIFSRFHRTSACDGRMDGRTDGHRAMTYISRCSIASRGKNDKEKTPAVLDLLGQSTL